MDGHDVFIGKSFSPVTGSYKKATQLSALERKVVRAKASGKTVKLKTASGGEKLVKPSPNREKNAPSAEGRKIWAQHKTERGKLTRVVASRKQTGLTNRAGYGSVEGFSMPDGRGGGRVVIHDDADFKTVSRHEMAHIKPRRNPVQMSQRFKDPVRHGREEGRADFIAHGRQTTGQYPGSDPFKVGYNEVQGKMAAAKFRKERFGR